MNISELSIRRPVMASVLTIIILLFGFIGYSYLGVREYPSVDNPIISVQCSYPGANADVIENQITEPLEQNINGIPGIRSLSSVSTAMDTPFSFMPSRQMNGAVRQASFFAMDMSGWLAEILSSAASATDL